MGSNRVRHDLSDLAAAAAAARGGAKLRLGAAGLGKLEKRRL